MAQSVQGNVRPYATWNISRCVLAQLFQIMPRVVPDQKAKFESDALLKQLREESEVCIKVYL